MMTLHSPIRHTDPARQFPLVKNGESRYNECGAEILLCGRSHLLHRGVGRFQLSTSRPLFALSLLYCIYGQFASSFFHGPDIPGRFSFCSASFLLRRRLVRRPSPRGVLLAAEEHLSRGGQVLRRPQRRLRRRLSGPSPDRACPAMAAAKKERYLMGRGALFLLRYKKFLQHTKGITSCGAAASAWPAGCRSTASTYIVPGAAALVL